MSDQGTGRSLGENDVESGFTCDRIYYVNEEIAKKYKKGDFMMMTEENIQLIKDSSTLVWERE